MNKGKYFLIYYSLINLISFVLFFLDKQRAKKDRWRIKEKTLHTFSILGGSLGSIAAMLLFHHKTKKPLFVIITATALMFNFFVIYKIFTYLL